METSHASDRNGFYENTTQMAGKWINDTTSMLTDAYNKQMNLSFGVYNNYVNSFVESFKNMIAPTKNNSSFFFQPDYLLKGMINPAKFMSFNDNWSMPSAKYMEKFYKQMVDFNHQWLNVYNKEFHLNGSNLNGVVEAFRKIMENELEAAKNIFMLYYDVTDEQWEFALESFKKIQEEMNKEFNRLVKSQEELVFAMMKSNNNGNEHTKHEHKEVEVSVHGHSPKKNKVHQDV